MLTKSYEDDLLKERKRKETTILATTISVDGYLVCGSKQGVITLWLLNDALKSNTKTDADLNFQAHTGSIYALQFAGKYLISGADEEIRIWEWSAILQSCSGKQPFAGKPAMELRPPQAIGLRGSLAQRPETNGLAYDQKRSLLVSANGDNNLYAWDLVKGVCVGAYSGHTDNVYCVSMLSPTSFCSGSEDGTVRLWDARSPNCLRTFDPSIGAETNTTASTERKSSSKRWISCIAVDESQSWMACGGGQHCLYLYHLASMSITATLPTAGTPQAVVFDGDRIVSVGNERFLYQWGKSGKYKGRTETHSSSLFSLSVSHKPKSGQGENVLVVAGNTPKVDLFFGESSFPFSITC